MTQRWDVVVIGAGAAGLMAAARAAAEGRRTLILEKNRKAGVKILMSGGTRCNLTHATDAAGIMEAFGRQGRFLRQALAVLSPSETVERFRRLGVATKVESTGKVFPVSNRAVEVRDALVRQAVESGSVLRLATPVQAITPQATGAIEVALEQETLLAQRVIVTVGGQSWPGCGTTGDGYGWLQRLGHTIHRPRPALVPLVGGPAWMHQLQGVTVERARLSVWPASGGRRPLEQREGSLLLTHFGLSGPVAMDVSRAVTQVEDPREVRLRIDLLPEMDDAQLKEWLAERRQRAGGRRLAAVLGEKLPRRLAEAIAGQVDPQRSAAAGPRANSAAGPGRSEFLADRSGEGAWAGEQAEAAGPRLAELSTGTAQQLIESLKRWTIALQGTRGFGKAEVTAGGVCLQEIDPRTMESRRVKGVHVAGEILDLDGWIGGYNFQSAFSTGEVAGAAAAAGIGEGAWRI